MGNFCPLLCSIRQRQKFFPCYEVTDQMRPNSTTHMSSGCPFVDACPCAPHHYCQRPRSLSQICTLLPILLKAAEKLIANPVLSKQTTWGMRGGPSTQQSRPPGAAMPWLEHRTCPDPGSLDPADNQYCSAEISAILRHAGCCPSSLPRPSLQWGVLLPTLCATV